MPYLESLLTAYQTGLDDRPVISLIVARAALAVATSADDRGRALAAVACALVRERVIPHRSSSLRKIGWASIDTSSVGDACDSHDAHARSGRAGGDSQMVVPVLGSDPGV